MYILGIRTKRLLSPSWTVPPPTPLQITLTISVLNGNKLISTGTNAVRRCLKPEVGKEPLLGPDQPMENYTGSWTREKQVNYRIG
jgi:hypothetical protein